MLLATVTFTFLGNYIFTAVVVVHLINKEAVSPNPRPVLRFSQTLNFLAMPPGLRSHLRAQSLNHAGEFDLGNKP